LREQTEISIAIPYVSTSNYKNISFKHNPLEDITMSYDELNCFCTGYFVVRAITPLISGSAVAPSTIDVIVEMKGGEDFEVEAPIANAWVPANSIDPFLPDPPALVAESEVRTAQEQSSFATAGQYDIRSDYLKHQIEIQDITRNAANTKLTSVHAMNCTGESFGNYRHLIKRFGWYRNVGNQNFGNERFPLAAPNFTLNGTSTNTSVVFDRGYNPLIYIAQMYAFYRGGIRFKVYNEGSNQSICQGINVKRSTIQSVNVPLSTQPLGYELEAKRIFEYNKPYYAPVPLNTVNDDFDLLKLNKEISRFIFSVGNSGNLHLSSAAADDFDLGFYLGAPFAVPLEWAAANDHLDVNNGFDASALRCAPFNPNTGDNAN